MKNALLKVSLIMGLLVCNVSYGDTVKQVYSCGNDIGIETRENGWLLVKGGEDTNERTNRMMSIALTLLSTQRPIGYYNAGDPGPWCGIANAKPITVLAIKAEE